MENCTGGVTCRQSQALYGSCGFVLLLATRDIRCLHRSQTDPKLQLQTAQFPRVKFGADSIYNWRKNSVVVFACHPLELLANPPATRRCCPPAGANCWICSDRLARRNGHTDDGNKIQDWFREKIVSSLKKTFGFAGFQTQQHPWVMQSRPLSTAHETLEEKGPDFTPSWGSLSCSTPQTEPCRACFARRLDLHTCRKHLV